MSISTSRPLKTLGDLLHRIGDVPPDRVRFVPAPGTATRDDILKPENEHCELVEGTLVEKAPGFLESALAVWIARYLWDYIETNDIGELVSETVHRII